MFPLISDERKEMQGIPLRQSWGEAILRAGAKRLMMSIALKWPSTP